MSLDNQLDTINELKAAIKSLEERIAHLEAEIKQNIKVSDTNNHTATITKAIIAPIACCAVAIEPSVCIRRSSGIEKPTRENNTFSK